MDNTEEKAEDGRRCQKRDGGRYPGPSFKAGGVWWVNQATKQASEEGQTGRIGTSQGSASGHNPNICVTVTWLVSVSGVFYRHTVFLQPYASGSGYSANLGNQPQIASGFN